jgi:hypothetical protein
MELKPQATTLNVKLEGQEIQELCRFGRTRHAPMIYRHLMEDKNDEHLILDELTNYIEAISNIGFKKFLTAMKFEMDFMYTNQVWILVDLSKGIKLIVHK